MKMDDREHADLANSIRDVILKIWPDAEMSPSHLRMQISKQIKEARMSCPDKGCDCNWLDKNGDATYQNGA